MSCHPAVLTRLGVMMYRCRVMSEARAYESPLRAEQLEQTRLRILEAVTEVVADEAVEELTVPLVAERARVSLRTVYRHFPTREALIDAWSDWVSETLSIHLHSYPETPEELVEFAPGLYRSYDENEALVKAMLNSHAARSVRVRSRRRRQRSVEQAIEQLTPDLAPEERRRALAVIYLLISAPAWQAMRDQWGLDGAEAGQAAEWAVRVLVDELRRNPDGIRNSKEGEQWP
jgi:AcrR family transcriptional regulator